jgi:hypothetical protein
MSRANVRAGVRACVANESRDDWQATRFAIAAAPTARAAAMPLGPMFRFISESN